MNFWGHQIARTAPFRDKVLAAQKNQNLQSIFKESWWFLSYMFGMNFGKSFFETRQNDKHCLLINDSDEDFITSDQPIINVHSKINDNDLAVPSNEEADFFYAISPKLGYMINKSNLFPHGINHVSIDFVKKMNRKLAFYSDQYIIGTTEHQLMAYKEFVGQRLKIIKEVNKLLKNLPLDENLHPNPSHHPLPMAKSNTTPFIQMCADDEVIRYSPNEIDSRETSILSMNHIYTFL